MSGRRSFFACRYSFPNIAMPRPRRPVWYLVCALAVALGAPTIATPAFADLVRIAVASNFNEPAREISRLFEQAIELSPGNQLGLSDLALVHFLASFYNWSDSRKASLEEMVSTAKKAVAANESDPLALTILAWAYLFANEWDEALLAIDRAISLSPSFAPAIGIRGCILACSDEPDLAAAGFDEAMRRSPRDGFAPFWMMGMFWAYHTIRDYKAAEAIARKAIRVAPNNPTFRRQLVVALQQQGREAETREALDEFLRIIPEATADDARNIPSRNKQQLERFVDILQAAGLPRGS